MFTSPSKDHRYFEDQPSTSARLFGRRPFGGPMTAPPATPPRLPNAATTTAGNRQDNSMNVTTTTAAAHHHRYDKEPPSASLTPPPAPYFVVPSSPGRDVVASTTRLAMINQLNHSVTTPAPAQRPQHLTYTATTTPNSSLYGPRPVAAGPGGLPSTNHPQASQQRGTAASYFHSSSIAKNIYHHPSSSSSSTLTAAHGAPSSNSAFHTHRAAGLSSPSSPPPPPPLTSHSTGILLDAHPYNPSSAAPTPSAVAADEPKQASSLPARTPHHVYAADAPPGVVQKKKEISKEPGIGHDLEPRHAPGLRSASESTDRSAIPLIGASIAPQPSPHRQYFLPPQPSAKLSPSLQMITDATAPTSSSGRAVPSRKSTLSPTNEASSSDNSDAPHEEEDYDSPVRPAPKYPPPSPTVTATSNNTTGARTAPTSRSPSSGGDVLGPHSKSTVPTNPLPKHASQSLDPSYSPTRAHSSGAAPPSLRNRNEDDHTTNDYDNIVVSPRASSIAAASGPPSMAESITTQDLAPPPPPPPTTATTNAPHAQQLSLRTAGMVAMSSPSRPPPPPPVSSAARVGSETRTSNASQSADRSLELLVRSSDAPLSGQHPYQHQPPQEGRDTPMVVAIRSIDSSIPPVVATHVRTHYDGDEPDPYLRRLQQQAPFHFQNYERDDRFYLHPLVAKGMHIAELGERNDLLEAEHEELAKLCLLARLSIASWRCRVDETRHRERLLHSQAAQWEELLSAIGWMNLHATVWALPTTMAAARQLGESDAALRSVPEESRIARVATLNRLEQQWQWRGQLKAKKAETQALFHKQQQEVSSTSMLQGNRSDNNNSAATTLADMLNSLGVVPTVEKEDPASSLLLNSNNPSAQQQKITTQPSSDERLNSVWRDVIVVGGKGYGHTDPHQQSSSSSFSPPQGRQNKNPIDIVFTFGGGDGSHDEEGGDNGGEKGEGMSSKLFDTFSPLAVKPAKRKGNEEPKPKLNVVQELSKNAESNLSKQQPAATTSIKPSSTTAAVSATIPKAYYSTVPSAPELTEGYDIHATKPNEPLDVPRAAVHIVHPTAPSASTTAQRQYVATSPSHRGSRPAILPHVTVETSSRPEPRDEEESWSVAPQAQNDRTPQRSTHRQKGILSPALGDDKDEDDEEGSTTSAPYEGGGGKQPHGRLRLDATLPNVSALSTLEVSHSFDPQPQSEQTTTNNYHPHSQPQPNPYAANQMSQQMMNVSVLSTSQEGAMSRSNVTAPAAAMAAPAVGRAAPSGGAAAVASAQGEEGGNAEVEDGFQTPQFHSEHSSSLGSISVNDVSEDED